MVQLKVAPTTLLANAPGFMASVGHTTILEIAETTGVGLIVIEKFIGLLTQLLRVALTEIFPRKAAPVMFAGAT